MLGKILPIPADATDNFKALRHRLSRDVGGVGRGAVIETERLVSLPRAEHFSGGLINNNNLHGQARNLFRLPECTPNTH
jgi:hypothetical protein